MAQSFIAGWFGGVCVLAVCHPFDTLKVRIQGATFDNRNLKDLAQKLQERAERLQAAGKGKRTWSPSLRRGGASVGVMADGVVAGSFTSTITPPRTLNFAQAIEEAMAITTTSTQVASATASSTAAKATPGLSAAAAYAPTPAGVAAESSVAAASKVCNIKSAITAALPNARPLCTERICLGTNQSLLVLRDMWHNEGLRGFYKGVMAPISGVGFATAAQFGVYGYVSRSLSWYRYGGDVHNLSDHLQNTNNLDVMDKVVSATCGGVAYALIIAPFEMVKVRLQTQIYFDHRRYYGALSCARKLYSEGGLRKLYLGLDVMLLRDIIGSVIYFGSYGLLRQQLPQGDALENIWSTLFAGGCAGVTQWAVIFPLDTIKTREQISKPKTYIDWVHCGRVLYRKEGLVAFYYGLCPALIRAFIGNAICFGGVETAMAMMDRLEGQHEAA